MNRLVYMKKTISILLVLMMLMSMVLITAEAEISDTAEIDEKINILQTLGILEYDVTADMYTQEVTRAQAVSGSIGLLGDLTEPITYSEYAFSDISDIPEANKIQFAYKMGCIDMTSWKFEPDISSTVGEVAKMIVSELGYKEVALDKAEGNLGFVTVAKMIGVLDGLSVSERDALCWSDFITMLYNAMDIEIMHLIGYNADGTVKYAKKAGLTMLNVYFDTYKISGVVNANAYTSIDDNADAGDGRVCIADTVMEVGESGADGLLGYHVTGYAKENNGIYTILYCKADDMNRTWEIAADNLMPNDSSWSAYRIVYEDENDRKKQLSLPSCISVVYNGIQLFDYTADDLKIETGKITAIDNNTDGVPEVVLVSSYENYVVESVNLSNKTVYCKYGKTLCLDDSLADVNIKSVKGEKYSLEDLTEYTVLCVEKSKDSSLINAVVCKNKVSGLVNQLREENGYTVFYLDSGKYSISKEWMQSSYSGKPEIKAGMRLLAYLDKDGKAAAIIEKSSGVIYAFLYGVKTEGGFSSSSVIRTFTEYGTWEDFYVSENVDVNGVRVESGDVASLPTVVNNKETIQQLVKIYVNDNNEVSKIYTAVNQSEAVDSDALVIGGSVNGTFKKLTLSFNNCQYTINNSAKIFVTPKKNGQYYEEAFEVVTVSALKNDRKYNLKLYDLTVTNTAKVGWLDGGSIADTDYWNNYAVYVKNVVTVYENDDTNIALECINKGVEVTYLAIDDLMIEGVKSGDIIIVHLNTKGYINADAVKLYEAGSTFEPGGKGFVLGTSAISSESGEAYAYYGTVTAKEDDMILIDTGTSGKKSMSVSNVKYVTFCDYNLNDTNRMFRTSTTAELAPNAKVLVYRRQGEVHDIAVFE